MKKLAALVAPLLLSATAFATITTYDWTGDVESPNKTLSAGTPVHGTIQIDDAAPRTIADGQPDDVRTYTAVQFTFDAGGQTWSSGGNREYTVRADHQGLVDCSLAQTSPVYYSFDWNVNVRDNRLDLFSSANLDTQWQGGTWGMEVSNPADGYFTDGFSGLIRTLTRRSDLASAGMADAEPVPEPSSAMLIGTSLFAWLGIRLKRRSPTPGGPSYI